MCAFMRVCKRGVCAFQSEQQPVVCGALLLLASRTLRGRSELKNTILAVAIIEFNGAYSRENVLCIGASWHEGGWHYSNLIFFLFNSSEMNKESFLLPAPPVPTPLALKLSKRKEWQSETILGIPTQKSHWDKWVLLSGKFVLAWIQRIMFGIEISFFLF